MSVSMSREENKTMPLQVMVNCDTGLGDTSRELILPGDVVSRWTLKVAVNTPGSYLPT